MVNTESPVGANGPLAGVLVADFGHVWAGPYCAATLADLGAQVIKVESSHRLDVHRRQGPYRGGEPDVNRSGVWNAQNRGKRSVTLNLRTEGGRRIARRLVDIADVAIENFSPGVMKRLGLSYDDVSQTNRGIIYASLSAFGQDGPQSDLVGYGPSLDAWSGLDSLNSYDDGVPESLGGVFPDTGSALYAAIAIIASLIERDKSMTGRFIDLSELETSALLIGEEIYARTLDPASRREANASRSSTCIRSLDGEWLFLGGPGFPETHVAELMDIGSRETGDKDDATGALATWAAARTATDIEAECRSRQIPMAKVNDVSDVLRDPHLRARGFFDASTHPRSFGLPIYGPIASMSKTPVRVVAEAPALGEGNDYLLFDLLGLSSGEVHALKEEKALE